MNPLRSFFGQFEHPAGIGGRIALAMMARSNRGLAAFAVDQLALGPESRALEVGFGHGVGLELAARRTPRGLVAGVDPGPAAVEVATARNRQLVEAGRVHVRSGAMQDIPFPDDSFDAAFTLNTVYFWRHQPDPALAEVRRVLAPGSILLVGFRTRPGAIGPLRTKPGLSPDEIEALRGAIRTAGFAAIELIPRPGAAEAVIVAHKPCDRPPARLP